MALIDFIKKHANAVPPTDFTWSDEHQEILTPIIFDVIFNRNFDPDVQQLRS